MPREAEWFWSWRCPSPWAVQTAHLFLCAREARCSIQPWGKAFVQMGLGPSLSQLSSLSELDWERERIKYLFATMNWKQYITPSFPGQWLRLCADLAVCTWSAADPIGHTLPGIAQASMAGSPLPPSPGTFSPLHVWGEETGQQAGMVSRDVELYMVL